MVSFSPCSTATMALQDKGTSNYISHSQLEFVLENPLLATYRGGNSDLLHQWFPLLEGFSPRFVTTVMDTYAPGATVVLDPFGGAGTAPLTVAAAGALGYYCELNPVLQFVTRVKAEVLNLGDHARRQLAEALLREASKLPGAIGDQLPDAELLGAYHSVFEGSRFFDDATLGHVLRLRTLADGLHREWPILGDLITVAVLASLVPSSLMKRAGDLRYMTPNELMKGSRVLTSEVVERLTCMATDVRTTRRATGRAVLVAQDATTLDRVPPLGAHAVITSPPYPNGTNYFRNTKLELWFLRALRAKSDLAYWRGKAVTAGINDVTRQKCDQPFPEAARETVEALERSAYDSRIPMMVGAYFSQMDAVLRAVRRHLAEDAVIAIDIGDSRYAGVHVPTDWILADIAGAEGYRLADAVPIRTRRSYDGSLLKQSLLVFRQSRPPLATRQVATSPDQRPDWIQFKELLPHQAHPYRKRNWGHRLHSLCSYQGKMKPSLAHWLVSIFVPEGGKVLDPFAGVGTIPFEACLQGKDSFAFEISPAALLISRAKLQRPNWQAVGTILERLTKFLASEQPSDEEIGATKHIDFNRKLDEYYHADTFQEILLARRFFANYSAPETEWSFVQACLLHILHGNRPYALSRRSHPITPFAPTGDFQYRPLMPALRAKVTRSLAVDYPQCFRDGRVFMQDATTSWPREVDDLDAVVTSPPFFDSTRFHLANWIRLWFCGWERQDFATRPLEFLDSRQKESMRVYQEVLRQARERLKPNGVAVLHLGRSTKCDMAGQLADIASPWFEVTDLFEEDVTHTESHGITDKGKVTGHQYLILR